MVGWRERSIRWRTPTTSPSGSRAPPRDSISLRSMPEQKAEPAPRTTTTRTSRRPSSRRTPRATREQGAVHGVAALGAVHGHGGDAVSDSGEDLRRPWRRWYHPGPCRVFRIHAARRAAHPREQIRRFIQDEIVPARAADRSRRAVIPDEDFERLSAKTKAAGLWALGAPEEYGGGGLDTFSMSVVLEEMSQHRMGLYSPGCGVFGRYPPPAIWAGSKAQIEKYAVPTIREGWRTFFAITEPLGRRRPGRRHPVPRRAARRHVGAERPQGLHLQRAQRQWGVVFARTNKEKGGPASPASSSSPGTPGLHRHAHPHASAPQSIPNDVVFEDCELPGEPDRRRKARGSISPSTCS